MTVASETSPTLSFTGNGVTTVFNTPRVFSAEELVVTLRLVSGIDVPQVLNTGYTVSASLGSITMALPPAVGETLFITSRVSRVQPISLAPLDTLPAKVLENGFDRLTLIVQELDSAAMTSLRLPLGADEVSTVLPVPTPSTILGWNGAGDALINIVLDPGTAIPVEGNGAVAQSAGGTGALTLGGALVTPDDAAQTTLAAALGDRAKVSGDTFTGEVTFQQNPHTGLSTLTDGATIAWNTLTAPVATVTLAGNRTLGAPTNLRAGATHVLFIKQGATGGRTLAFNAAFKFPGGTAPVLSTAANAVDVLSCVTDGTSMFAVLQKGFA